MMLTGLGLIAWVAWASVERYYPSLLGRSGEQAANVQVSQATQRPNAGYKIHTIVAAHLFGAAAQKVVEAPTQAPETKLRLNLFGVLATSDADLARALIQVESKRMKAYSIGDAIDGTDAQLHKVETQRVILDRKGKFESLAMVRKKTKLN